MSRILWEGDLQIPSKRNGELTGGGDLGFGACWRRRRRGHGGGNCERVGGGNCDIRRRCNFGEGKCDFGRRVSGVSHNVRLRRRRRRSSCE